MTFVGWLQIAAVLLAVLVTARPLGLYMAKVFQGGSEKELLARLKQDFTTIRHVKPPASRADSAEVYVVAQGFRRAAPQA